MSMLVAASLRPMRQARPRETSGTSGRESNKVRAADSMGRSELLAGLLKVLVCVDRPMPIEYCNRRNATSPSGLPVGAATMLADAGKDFLGTATAKVSQLVDAPMRGAVQSQSSPVELMAGKHAEESFRIRIACVAALHQMTELCRSRCCLLLLFNLNVHHSAGVRSVNLDACASSHLTDRVQSDSIECCMI
ncbi:hypothetical protein IE81DRAFT_179026 [Ceraceosorus guamensis]|uniref:Uncharacterized protein n=1 Tax=Ceraceosorus guamensis TaxID=1522189 RepID=A0A316VVQ4_9BASI|nr:hypothetical protein IE81DRAFT_179026 [Ceraceosorus guamensis]PWN41374.1 hypothetical protein IE81DRAFT_179026 [Ceraceosorus guamensis]